MFFQGVREFKMTLNKCYFCEQMPDEEQPEKQGNDWFVECWNCGARGPTCGAIDKFEDHFAKIVATRGWNKEEYDYEEEYNKFIT